jgi:VanZ family protein
VRRGHWLDAVVGVLVLGIVYASLARRGAVECAGFAAALLREARYLSGSDALGNVFAYLLLGAALAFAWSARVTPAAARGPTPWGASLAAVLACAALSFSMEAAQACLTDRMSSHWDLLTNTLGGGLGWFAGRAVQRIWATVVTDRADPGVDTRLLLAVLLAVLAWWVAATAPWVPSSTPSIWWTNAGHGWHALGAGPLDPWRLAQRTGEWLALGLALSLALRRPAWAAPLLAALAAAMLAWRGLLPPGSMPSPERLAALPPATLAVLALATVRPRVRAALALAAALVAVAAYELEPGYGPVSPFRWRVVLLAGDPVPAIELAAWFGWFAVTVVCTGRVLGGRPALWALVPALVLAALEGLQTMVPGRTADLSPPVIALACAGLAAGILGGRRRP